MAEEGNASTWRKGCLIIEHTASVTCLICRNLDNMDDLHFGVHRDMMYARNVPAVQGAQWTGVVTQIAIDMLESGKVDAVICVQSDEQDRFKPKPVSSLKLSSFLTAEDHQSLCLNQPVTQSQSSCAYLASQSKLCYQVQHVSTA